MFDAILGADLDAARKQRHTVTRIFHRLVAGHDAEVSYQQVRRYVADRRLASTRARAEKLAKTG